MYGMGEINVGLAGRLNAEIAVGEAAPARVQLIPRVHGGRFGSFSTITVSAVASVSGTSVHA
jgi:hypothetical protein